MNDFNSIPTALSHKKLNEFLIRAPKEDIITDQSYSESQKEKEELNKLLFQWSESSKKIIKILSTKESSLMKECSSKSLMAFGALEAYIKLALQAKEISDIDD
tara:strand:- start:1038 stop:1346 length:309 start_codon:yes stop_codon:yes gene_type:complete